MSRFVKETFLQPTLSAAPIFHPFVDRSHDAVPKSPGLSSPFNSFVLVMSTPLGQSPLFVRRGTLTSAPLHPIHGKNPSGKDGFFGFGPREP